MATRSTISIKVKKADKGKTFHFDRNKLPKDVGYQDDFINMIEDVTIEGDYLTIYHHWDGYPDGVGKTLIEKFNTYTSALNLLLGGDTSSINGDVIIQYCAWRGEKWNDEYGGVQPKQSNKVPDLEEEYAYLFKNNKWYFIGGGVTKWTEVKSYLYD